MLVREYDLEDRIAELEEEVAELDDSQDDLLSEIDGQFESYAEVPSAFVDTWDELEEQRIEKSGKVKRLRDIIDEYGGSTWRIQELTAGDLARIQDATGVDLEDVDGGQSQTGAGAAMIEAVRASVRDSPPDAPDIPDYSHHLVEELFEAINALNTVGELEMGNSSLREAMSS